MKTTADFPTVTDQIFSNLNLKRNEIIERKYSDTRRNCLSCQRGFSSWNRRVSNESYSSKPPLLWHKRLSFLRHENKHPGVYSTFLNRQRQSPHVSDEFHRTFLQPQTTFNSASSHLGRLLRFVFFFLFCIIRAKLPNASKKIKTSQIKNIKTLSDFVINSYGESIILWKITSPCSEPVSHSWKK